MPCKKAKQVPASEEAEISGGTSASGRSRNYREALAESRTGNNGGTAASNGTRNNDEASTSIRTSTINQMTTTNDTFSNKDERFVLLRDEKTSRHFMFRRDQLSSSKKDNFKIGTHAIFHGDADQSTRCRGVIVLSGKNEET